MRIDPEMEKTYGQLLWAERRRQRILLAVSSHFGAAATEKAMAGVPPSPLANEPTFAGLIDERDPLEFLTWLAEQELATEAATISALRAHASAYQSHVDEQILFGARTAGQEAGRSFFARNRSLNTERLGLPEAIQAIFELTFHGVPGEKNYFLSLRAHGGSTVHVSRSPQLEAWKSAGADPKFLHALQGEWIRGMLDILSPATSYTSAQSLEEGHSFGLAQFHLQEAHAGP